MLRMAALILGLFAVLGVSGLACSDDDGRATPQLDLGKIVDAAPVVDAPPADTAAADVAPAEAGSDVATPDGPAPDTLVTDASPDITVDAAADAATD